MMEIKIIVGSAGTGKTTKLINIMQNNAGNSHFYCSFTRMAAKEGKNKLPSLYNASTIHSLAFKLGGFIRQQVIADEQLTEFSKICKYPISQANEQLIGNEMLSFIHLAESKMINLDSAYKMYKPHFLLKQLNSLYEKYNLYKKDNGYIDFNDMLKIDVDIHFHTLYIDEAQDLTPLQWQFLKKIKCENVYIAGDDDQSIYSWQGANSMDMYNVMGAATNIEILSQSHRLPIKIFNLSQKILSKVKLRYEKIVSPNNKKGNIYRYNSINAINPIIFNKDFSTLLLIRNHSVRYNIEEFLINNNIPYNTTNQDGFFDNAIARLVKKWERAKKNHDFEILKEIYKKDIDNDLLLSMNWYEAVHIKNIKQLKYLKNVDILSKSNTLLSTIHSAKGLEADNVIILNSMGNRTWENIANDMDAEQRVWYVATTRARENLYIIKGDNYEFHF